MVEPRSPVSEFEEYSARREAQGGAPPEQFVVRVASELDLGEIAEIAAARESEPVEQWRRSIIRTYEATSDGLAQLVVADCRGGIAGYGKTGYFSPAEDSPPNVAPPGWYLTGLVVRPAYRRQGIGFQLTIARLRWIAGRADRAFYFANARNRVSIELHRAAGFVALTKDFHHPDAVFEGGVGILFARALEDFG